MKVIIGADHAGYGYKELIVAELKQQGYEVLDLGTHCLEPNDYPDRASDVAMVLLNNKGDRGILICGSAVGISIAANKFKGIRAGVCHDTYSAHQALEHDDINILCIGECVIDIEVTKEIVLVFLKATFSNVPRHKRRLNKIYNIENKNMKGDTI